MYMYFTHHVHCSQWMVVCKLNNVMYQEPMKKKEGEGAHNSHAINNKIARHLTGVTIFRCLYVAMPTTRVELKLIETTHTTSKEKKLVHVHNVCS